jgi:hypothetical protein
MLTWNSGISINKQTSYILLGQPCDLMVRSIGERAGKRASEHQIVSLVPLHRINQTEFRKKPSYHWKTHAPLDYYYLDSNDIAELGFAAAELLDVDVLDLSVLEPSGLCLLDLNQSIPIPGICRSGWKMRFENLIKQYSDERIRLDEI